MNVSKQLIQRLAVMVYEAIKDPVNAGDGQDILSEIEDLLKSEGIDVEAEAKEYLQTL